MEDVGRCWKTGFSMVFPCFPRGLCSTRVEKVQASPSSSWGSACRFGPWHGNAWRISGQIVQQKPIWNLTGSHWLYDCCCTDLRGTLPPLCRSLLSLWGNSSKRRPRSWPIYKTQLPRQSGAPHANLEWHSADVGPWTSRNLMQIGHCIKHLGAMFEAHSILSYSVSVIKSGTQFWVLILEKQGSKMADTSVRLGDPGMWQSCLWGLVGKRLGRGPVRAWSNGWRGGAFAMQNNSYRWIRQTSTDKTGKHIYTCKIL